MDGLERFGGHIVAWIKFGQKETGATFVHMDASLYPDVTLHLGGSKRRIRARGALIPIGKCISLLGLDRIMLHTLPTSCS